MTEAPGIERLGQRWPWRGGHLQTIRNAVMRRFGGLPPQSGRRLWMPADDGSGDLVALRLSLPSPDVRSKLPLVLLIHGLTGCEDSMNQRVSADYFLRHGFPVARLNLRGAGPSERFCRKRYHSGHWQDLAAAIRHLDAEPGAPTGQGIVAMGVSLGGTILLNHLIASGENHGLRAAVTVSTPLDLSESSGNFLKRSNRVYNGYLLERMKDFTRTAAPGRDWQEVIDNCRSVREFDDRIVAPWNGFDGAEDYYRRCSPARALSDIRCRSLLIHALDDPWIPATAYRQGVSGNPSIKVKLFRHGGHVGFHASGSKVARHNELAREFFERSG